MYSVRAQAKAALAIFRSIAPLFMVLVVFAFFVLFIFLFGLSEPAPCIGKLDNLSFECVVATWEVNSENVVRLVIV